MPIGRDFQSYARDKAKRKKDRISAAKAKAVIRAKEEEKRKTQVKQAKKQLEKISNRMAGKQAPAISHVKKKQTQEQKKQITNVTKALGSGTHYRSKRTTLESTKSIINSNKSDKSKAIAVTANVIRSTTRGNNYVREAQKQLATSLINKAAKTKAEKADIKNKATDIAVKDFVATNKTHGERAMSGIGGSAEKMLQNISKDGVRTDDRVKQIEKVQNSKAYKRGKSGRDLALTVAMTAAMPTGAAVGAGARAAQIASGGAKQLGKEIGKTALRSVAEGALPNAVISAADSGGSGKQFAKNLAVNAAGDLALGGVVGGATVRKAIKAKPDIELPTPKIEAKKPFPEKTVTKSSKTAVSGKTGYANKTEPILPKKQAAKLRSNSVLGGKPRDLSTDAKTLSNRAYGRDIRSGGFSSKILKEKALKEYRGFIKSDNAPILSKSAQKKMSKISKDVYFKDGKGLTVKASGKRLIETHLDYTPIEEKVGGKIRYKLVKGEHELPLKNKAQFDYAVHVKSQIADEAEKAVNANRTLTAVKVRNNLADANTTVKVSAHNGEAFSGKKADAIEYLTGKKNEEVNYLTLTRDKKVSEAATDSYAKAITRDYNQRINAATEYYDGEISKLGEVNKSRHIEHVVNNRGEKVKGASEEIGAKLDAKRKAEIDYLVRARDKKVYEAVSDSQAKNIKTDYNGRIASVNKHYDEITPSTGEPNKFATRYDSTATTNSAEDVLKSEKPSFKETADFNSRSDANVEKQDYSEYNIGSKEKDYDGAGSEKSVESISEQGTDTRGNLERGAENELSNGRQNSRLDVEGRVHNRTDSETSSLGVVTKLDQESEQRLKGVVKDFENIDNRLADTEPDRRFFIGSLKRNAESQPYGVAVDAEYKLSDLDGAVAIATKDGEATIMVKPDGDIVAFSKLKWSTSNANDLLFTAVAHGGDRMDCYGIGLVNKYQQFGFEPVARVAFDPQYVSPEVEKVLRDLRADGKPSDVYVLAHNGDKLEQIKANQASGKYKVWTQGELDSLKTMDYDDAMNMRDELLSQRTAKSEAESATKAEIEEAKGLSGVTLKEGELKNTNPKVIRLAENYKRENPSNPCEYSASLISKEIGKTVSASRGVSGVWNKFREWFTNSMFGLDDLAKELDNIGKRELAQEIIAGESTMRSAKTKAIAALGGQGERLDYFGRPIKGSKSFFATLEDVKSYGKVIAGDEQVAMTAFDNYLLNLHNIERWEQGKPIWHSISADESEVTCNQILESYPQFKKFANDVHSFYHDELRRGVDAGWLKEDMYNDLMSTYPNYVPTFRNGKSTIANDVVFNRSTVSVATGKAAKADIADLEVLSSPEQALKIVTANRNREAVNDMINLLDDVDANTGGTLGVINRTNFDPENMPDGFIPDLDEMITNDLGSAQFNLRGFDRDGNPFSLSVPEPIYRAFANQKKQYNESLSKAKQVLSKTNNVYKALITSWNPMFLIRNGLKDAQELVVTSAHLAETTKQAGEAFKGIATGSDEFRLFQQMGGSHGSFFEMAANYKGGFWNKVKGQTLDRMEQINQFVEQAPRFAEFRGTISKELSKYDIKLGETEKIAKFMDEKPNEWRQILEKASHDAADVTVDFSRNGTVGRVLNAYFVPFFNPAIQGTSRAVRVFTQTKGAKEWATLACKIAALGIAPSVLNEVLLSDNEDYQGLNARDKDNNYLFALGDGRFLKMPKGRILQVFGSAGQNVTRALKGKDTELISMLDTAWTSNAPSNPLESNLLSPLLLAKRNKTWYGSSIDPTYATSDGSTKTSYLYPADRGTANTTAMSIKLSKLLSNNPITKNALERNEMVSPNKLDYLMDAYSGVIGDLAMPAMKKYTSSPYNNKTVSGSIKNWLSKSFTIDSTVNNKWGNKFYDELQKAVGDSSSTRSKKLSDRAANKFLTSYSNEASEYSAASREIMMNGKLSAESAKLIKGGEKYVGKKLTFEEKKKLISELYKGRTNVYKNALSRENDYKKFIDQYKNRYDVENEESKGYKSLVDTAKMLTAEKHGESAYDYLRNNIFNDNQKNKKRISVIAEKNGMSPIVYKDYVQSVVKDADADGNGFLKKAEVIKYLNGRNDLSRADKATLYYATNGNFVRWGNNPYGSTSGKSNSANVAVNTHERTITKDFGDLKKQQDNGYWVGKKKEKLDIPKIESTRSQFYWIKYLKKLDKQIDNIEQTNVGDYIHYKDGTTWYNPKKYKQVKTSSHNVVANVASEKAKRKRGGKKHSSGSRKSSKAKSVNVSSGAVALPTKSAASNIKRSSGSSSSRVYSAKKASAKNVKIKWTNIRKLLEHYK